MSENQPPVVVGRYLLHRKIARGGMATIHIARLIGDVGFSRIVAAKRMHPELAENSEFVAMFLDEARIASRVQHRNVVSVLDVVTLGEEVMLVQEYVHGAPLGVLLRVAYERRSHVPVPVAAAIACQILAGLHAAHDTTDELGTPLHIVHRDVSPQNILIAIDGTARLLDFGVAKASMSAHVTRKGTFKGKLGYSSPEQIRGEAERQSDIYSLGVVLWELIVGHRLHAAQNDAQLIAEIMDGNTPPITEALAEDRTFMGAYRWSQLEAIEPVIRKALDVNPRRRWETAADMEEAIAAVVPIASAADVTAWLRAVGQEFLDEREQLIAEEEASWRRNAHLLVRSGSESEVPVTTASEPGTAPHSSIPTTIIATLIVTLIVAVALLDRDLDTTVAPTHASGTPSSVPSAQTNPTASSHVTATPAAPAAAASRQPSVATPPPRATDEPLVDTSAPDRASTSEVSREEPPPPDAEPMPAAAKPLGRTRPARPPPPARTQVASPPKTPAVTLDCSTPFYFEGHKKIFKAGCL